MKRRQRHTIPLSPLRILGMALSLSFLLGTTAPTAHAQTIPPQGKTGSASTSASTSSSAFTSNSETPVQITADSLEYRENEKVYIARGKAQVTRGEVTITANLMRAHFIQSAGKDPEVTHVIAEASPGNEDKVIITYGENRENTATGTRGEYDARSGRATLTGNHLRLTTPQDTVSAEESLAYFEKENRAIATGNALAIRETETGATNKISADILSAQLAPDENGSLEVHKIHAKGNVIIVTPNEVAQGNTGEYDVPSQKAVLQGGVKITRGENQLNGARAEVDLSRGESRLLSGTSGKRVKGLFVPEKSQEAR